jgi:hypothetical protein
MLNKRPMSSLFKINSDKKYPIAVSRFFMYISQNTNFARANCFAPEIVEVQILREMATLQFGKTISARVVKSFPIF